MKKHQDINILMFQFPQDSVMDPSYVRFSDEYIYLDNLNLRLIDLGKKGEYQLSLADEINFDETKTKVSITLKKAYFSDGTQITSRDVVNSFKRVILQGSPHSKPKEMFLDAEKLKSIDDKISAFEILNDLKLIINLKKPIKELFYYLYLVDYSIIHKKLIHSKKLHLKDWSSYVSGAYLLKWDTEKSRPFLIKNKYFLNFNLKSPVKINILSNNNDASLISDLKTESVDFGSLNFNQFLKATTSVKDIYNRYKFVGEKYDSVVYLVLNLKSKVFSNKRIRRSIYKKIYKNFKLSNNQGYSYKASQYFLPGAKGYIHKSEIEKILNENDFNLNEIPKEITIKTLTTMRKYVPENISDLIGKALDRKVKIKYSIKPDDLHKNLLERDFDIILKTSSMSYKVLGETLNYVYNKDFPTFLDPTNNISDNLDLYSSEKDESGKYINLILKQMILDSECIPLFYSASPIFINKNKFDTDQINIQESFQFWKFNLK